jgi:cytochrome c oxidase subunit 2
MNGLLRPASEYARDVAQLSWWMIAVATLVWLAVTGCVLWALWSRRRSVAIEGAPESPGNRGESSRGATLAVATATALTVVILFAFMAYDFVVGRAHAQPHDPLDADGALSVTVVGRQWWWEFIYDDTVPEKRLSTANELHIPAGVPILLALRSPDVIHSAWIPRLAGKQDLTPGYFTALRFTADSAGVYEGVCAEFCGAQHANMRFQVVAHPPEEFQRWRARESAPASPPTDPLAREGEKVFLASTCAACHAVAGTDARGTIGPALTHVASRRAIAANTVANTPENMARWIRDPQRIKPGTQMPSNDMPESSLRALVAYLRSLR